MKEELIRVLNNKLDDINSDIASLNGINDKINEENEQLTFINRILELFNSDGNADPMNFDKISYEDFEKALAMTGDDTKGLFDSDVCNYDGLVYLISGIKNGITINLTNEQVNSIEFFIQALTEKKEMIEATIDGYQEVVNKYDSSNVSELENKRDKYVSIKEDLDNNEYVKDTELIKEAIEYSGLESPKIIEILSFILKYNADLYKDNKPITNIIENSFEEKEEPVEETTLEEKEENEEPEENNEFHFEQINNDVFNLPSIDFEDSNNEEKEEPEENTDNTITNTIPIEPITFGESLANPIENTVSNDYPTFKSFDEIINNSLNIPSNTDYIPLTDINQFEISKDETEENNDEIPVVEPPLEFNVDNNLETEEKINDNEFNNIDINNDETEEEEKVDEKAVSTRELHKIFGKYGIEENVILNELIDGDINEFQSTLDTLKDNSILDDFKKNKELLIETLLYSNAGVINRVLSIVKEDLSTDEEDYEITLKIAINTIPSIFIKEGGNYDNFISNVEVFKRLELNLINLFDFSKEVFIADNELVTRNLDIVNQYDFDIDYKNVKYFLLIPNIEEKIDYYVESVYEDKLKNETFDGIKFIKEFAAKLNVVTDETIKRLRYASTNGSKVFGSKPGSLTGEITNLKVNTLDMNDIYLNSFFDNEFSGIANDEVREYVKLVHNSSNVGDYSDELDKLNEYRNGLRYTIEGINVSYNKVVRNYNILRSYGIDTKKALQFAVCYNLVITKDEYNRLNDLLDKIGGNA